MIPRPHDFVTGGFSLKVAKSNATYLDDDTILFATDFGSGTLTKSSYPRIVKLWHRGEPIDSAKTVYEAEEAGDISGEPARVPRTLRRGSRVGSASGITVLPYLVNILRCCPTDRR